MARAAAGRPPPAGDLYPVRLAYATVELDLPDRLAARIWIIRNQFGRRNLIAYIRSVLALQLKNALAEQAKERQRGGQGGVLLRQNSDEAKGRTDEQKAAVGVEGGALFTCDRCADTFTAPVWHCPRCDHHWPVDRLECGNCRANNRPVRQNSDERGRTDEQVAALAGTSRDTIRKVDYLEQNAPPELKAQLATGEVSINAGYQQVRRGKRRAKRAETLRDKALTPPPALTTLPSRYPILYADPPWRNEHSASDSRAIENQYPTMPLAEICALPARRMLRRECRDRAAESSSHPGPAEGRANPPVLLPYRRTTPISGAELCFCAGFQAPSGCVPGLSVIGGVRFARHPRTGGRATPVSLRAVGSALGKAGSPLPWRRRRGGAGGGAQSSREIRGGTAPHRRTAVYPVTAAPAPRRPSASLSSPRLRPGVEPPGGRPRAPAPGHRPRR